MKIYCYRVLAAIVGVVIMLIISLVENLSQGQFKKLSEIYYLILKSFFHWGQ